MSRNRRTFLTTFAAAAATLPLADCAGDDEQSGDDGTDSMNNETTESMDGEGMTESMAGETEAESMNGDAMTESMTESADGETMDDGEMNDAMAENETAS